MIERATSGASGSGSGPRRATTRDPRSIITPDAFAVAPALLGTALATPGRRMAAMAIDLLVIGALTVVTRSFALVLGVVVSILLVRAGLRRIPLRGSVFDRAMRLSVGCLGLFVGFLTFVVWAAMDFDLGGGPEVDLATMSDTGEVRVGRAALGPLLSAAGGGFTFRNADDAEEAEEAARELAETAAVLGMPLGEIREILEGLVRAEAPWADEAEAIIDRAVEAGRLAARVAGPLADSMVDSAGDTGAAGASADPSHTTAEGALPTAEPLSGAAADSVATLLGLLEDREIEARAALARQRAAELELAEREEGGILAGLRNVVDLLGFGFGWATLYMTLTVSGWKGRTVGKRLLGIRVVRLDGEPLTWWTAFERAGGYAAGFATGLLGFAQIYWDANRQAIHDRIVGTVVVRDGVDRVLDWESAT